MKVLIALFVLFLSKNTFAMSDIDRAILFGANTASMGTYIAQMEMEMERIRINYEKQAAEFHQVLEKDYQRYYKETVLQEVASLKKIKSEYLALAEPLKQKKTGFNELVSLAGKIYKGRIKLEGIVFELQKLEQIYPGIQVEWNGLVKEILSQNSKNNISSQDLERLVSDASRLFANSTVLESDLKDQLTLIDLKIEALEKKIAGLK